MAPDCVRCVVSPIARARPKSRILTWPFFAFQPEVGRFDVTVDKTFFVSGLKTLGNFPAYAEDFRHRKPGFTLEPVIQGFAFQELHGQEGSATVLADLVNGDDVGMLESGSRLGLTEETLLGTRTASHRRQHGFQGHQSFQVRVFRSEDHTHAASTQHLQHPVRPKSPNFVRLFRWCQEIV